MKKSSKNTVFGKFKIGDKVWYPEFCQPFGRVPGIVMEDRIESVGKKRDEYIKQDISEYVPFEDTDPGMVTRRRKEFPSERKRLELSKLGLEKEYIKMKDNSKNMLKQREKELLETINRRFESGAYMEWYLDRGYSIDEINRLIDRDLIHKQKSSFNINKYILCPKGKNYI